MSSKGGSLIYLESGILIVHKLVLILYQFGIIKSVKVLIGNIIFYILIIMNFNPSTLQQSIPNFKIIWIKNIYDSDSAVYKL